VNAYPRPFRRLYRAGSLAHRGRRRSRRLMTERGAASDNDAAVEPREAQRPPSLAARTPTAAIPGNGDIAVGALAGREVRPAGYVSLPYKGAVAQLPGASRRSIPSFSRGDGKQGYGLPGARKTKSPDDFARPPPPRSFRPRLQSNRVPESITTKGAITDGRMPHEHRAYGFRYSPLARSAGMTAEKRPLGARFLQ
jgi:hypothetical protein